MRAELNRQQWEAARDQQVELFKQDKLPRLYSEKPTGVAVMLNVSLSAPPARLRVVLVTPAVLTVNESLPGPPSITAVRFGSVVE